MYYQMNQVCDANETNFSWYRTIWHVGMIMVYLVYDMWFLIDLSDTSQIVSSFSIDVIVELDLLLALNILTHLRERSTRKDTDYE